MSTAALSPAPLGAALWMAGAIASFSLMAVAGRELSDTLDTFEIMAFRSIVGLACVLSVGIALGRLSEVRTSHLGLHALRNVAHFTGQNLWFYAIATIPLAQVFALEFTSPLWVAVLAPLLLGETMTRARLAAIALGFIGILIVVRPGVVPLEMGHLTAALSALGFAGSVLATKALARTETVWAILFWMTLSQSVFGLICAGFDADIALPAVADLPWVVVVGLCGLSAHLCITSALTLAPATIVAPMDFLRLPLIAIIGMLAYGEALEVAVFGGAALILAANLLNIRASTR